MALAVSAYVLSAAALLFLSPAGTSAQEDGTCRACNCQFNNVEVLRQLIESMIRDILVNDTGSTQAIEERVINTLNTDTTSTQTLETRITNTVETNLASWTPISLTHLYSVHIASATTYSISISSGTIPNTAREMLTYIYVFCYASSSSQSGDLQFYVVQDGVTYSKRMYLYGYSGDYTINSENMWFPMTTNRVLYFQVPSVFSNCYAYIYAIGYR